MMPVFIMQKLKQKTVYNLTAFTQIKRVNGSQVLLIKCTQFIYHQGVMISVTVIKSFLLGGFKTIFKSFGVHHSK